ncbi:uracil-DNA glycosylase family protein [Parabacteroides sp. OttesenSCG-928-G06]|nr:uracil-DNA glycosylase family protein [Parabacteroides sp. OttesenSCG-928-G06]
MSREKFVAELKAFYETNGIIPYKGFACKNQEKCGITLEKHAPGMQCHVGKHYGENCPKVLVVALDCGGGAQSIDARTETIEDVMNHPINLHMKGTLKTIREFLKKSDTECLKHYAMTNACKCSWRDSTNQLHYSFYQNCSTLKLREIEILNPDVIFFQGKNALIDVAFSSDVKGVPTHLAPYIKYANINGQKYLSVLCIHPSARFRHARKRIEFYDKTIVEIIDFIKDSRLCTKQ